MQDLATSMSARLKYELPECSDEVGQCLLIPKKSVRHPGFDCMTAGLQDGHGQGLDGTGAKKPVPGVRKWPSRVPDGLDASAFSAFYFCVIGDQSIVCDSTLSGF
jgi:hypothetical protein